MLGPAGVGRFVCSLRGAALGALPLR
jgi:hypothetical protein